MPKVNQDRLIIDAFPLAYDEYCTPYDDKDFSEDIRHTLTRTRVVKLQPCKAIFIGDVGVGKTTIVNRFCFNRFQDAYKATIGVDFEVENFRILGQSFGLQIWDTAGQERFKCIAQAYYRNANIIVIVYDMTKEESLNTAKNWLHSALAVNSIHTPLIFLVGSKSDLLDEEEFIAMERLAYDVARAMLAEYWSVSARTGFNIVELFQRIASLAFESMTRQLIIESTIDSDENENRRNFFQSIADNFECNRNSEPTTASKCTC